MFMALMKKILSKILKNDKGIGDTASRALVAVGFDKCKSCDVRREKLNNFYTYKEMKVDKEFQGKHVLVEIYSDKCPFCAKMSPIVTEFANTQKDVSVIRINSAGRQDLQQKYGLISLPSYLVFKDGVLSGVIRGYVEKEEFIKKVLNPYLPNDVKKYQLTDAQVSKIMSAISKMSITGAEAESIVELKIALSNPNIQVKEEKNGKAA